MTIHFDVFPSILFALFQKNICNVMPDVLHCNVDFSSQCFCKNMQRANDVKMTLYQRRCDVITSHRRRYDVILTLNARWDVLAHIWVDRAG